MLENLKNEMIIRGFSQTTQQAYLHYNQMFLNHINKQPEEISLADVKAFMAHIVSNLEFKERTRNLVLASLKFMYDEVIEREQVLIGKKIKSVKPTEKEPDLLTKKQLITVYNSIDNLKYQVLFGMYAGSGTRTTELISVLKTDIDQKDWLFAIRKAKGRKFRNGIISPRIKPKLKEYLASRQDDNPHLFPGAKGKHLTRQQAFKIIKKVVKEAGIEKRVYPHMLRSSFATAYLDEGGNIGDLQELLGHVSADTTKIYTTYSKKKMKSMKSPF